jgi:isoquinoline 1-oxidoreductase alpha subunit
MLTLDCKGEVRQFDVPADVSPLQILQILRDVAELMSNKFGCGMALCGCCIVHLDGEPMRSYVAAARDAVDRKISMIEAIGATPAGALIQKGWLEL